MKTSKIKKAINRLSKEDFLEIFTPFSYYNLNIEGAYDHILFNVYGITDFKNTKPKVNEIISIEQQEEISEFLLEKLIDYADDFDDLAENFVSFEWYNLMYFVLFEELKDNNYRCIPALYYK